MQFHINKLFVLPEVDFICVTTIHISIVVFGRRIWSTPHH